MITLLITKGLSCQPPLLSDILGLCVQNCPQNKFLWEQALLCVQRCPMGYNNNISQKKCKSVCPHSQFLQQNTCLNCNQNCNLCLKYQSCILCQQGFYQAKGVCYPFSRKLQTTTPKYKIIQTGPNTYEAVFDIDPAQYPNLNFDVSIANPSAVVDQNGNIPTVSKQQITLKQPQNFSAGTLNKYVVQTVTFLLVLYSFAVFLCFWQGLSVWIYSCSILQLLAITYYVNVTYAPSLHSSLIQTQLVFLNYLPNPFMSALGNYTLISGLPSKLIDTIGDNTFTRGGGSTVLIFLLALGIWLVLRLITWKRLQLSQNMTKIIRKFLKNVYQFKVISQLIVMFYCQIVFQGILQFSQPLTQKSSQIMSLIMGTLLLGLAVLWPCLKAYKEWRGSQGRVRLQYLIQKCQNSILSNCNSVDLYKNNVFLFQNKYVDLRNPRVPKYNSQNLFTYQTADSYLFSKRMNSLVILFRLFVTCLTFAASIGNPLIQVGCFILLNFCYLCYLLYFWPNREIVFNIRLQNWYSVVSELFLNIYLILVLFYTISAKSSTIDSRLVMCNIILIALVFNIFLHVFYLLAKGFHEFYVRVWLYLSTTQWFSQTFPQKHMQMIKEGTKPQVKKLLKEDVKDFQKAILKGQKKRQKGLRSNINLDLVNQDYLPQHLKKKPSIGEIIMTKRSQRSSSRTSLSKSERRQIMKQRIFKKVKQDYINNPQDGQFQQVLNNDDAFFQKFHKKPVIKQEVVQEISQADLTWQFYEQQYELQQFQRERGKILANSKGDFAIQDS